MTGHWQRIMRIVDRYNAEQNCEHEWINLTKVAGSGTSYYECLKCGKQDAVGIDPGVYS